MPAKPALAKGAQAKSHIIDIAKCLMVYLTHCSQVDSVYFRQQVNKFAQVTRSFDDARTDDDLRLLIGSFLKDTFCYLYNFFIKEHYLKVVGEFQTKVSTEKLVETLQSEKTHKKFGSTFNRFLGLPLYFRDPCEEKYLASIVTDTLAAATQRASPGLFGMNKAAERFSSQVLPKLKEISTQTAKYEHCHLFADAIWNFQRYLRESVYQGPLIPLHRGGNFNLVDSPYSHISYFNKSQSEVDTRFPMQPPPQTEKGGIAECIAIRGYMREQYAEALLQFERETAAAMEPLADDLCGGDRVSREHNAVLAASAEKVRRRTHHQVEKVRRGAAREIRDLQEQIAAVKARKAAPPPDPQTEIRAKLEELALVEESAQIEFAQLQAVLVCARRHLAAELKALVSLCKGGQTEDRAAELLRERLLIGESIDEITADLEQQWTRIAF
jgi:hypothetical protein